MASNIPIVRKIAWISIIPQILFMLLLLFIFHKVTTRDPAWYAFISYLIISISLRYLIPKSHRKGIKFIKEKKFDNAIPEFEKSYQFFTQNNWIDKYRYFTMLSSSKMNYTEMALCNIAFCHSQIGNGKEAISFYEKALKEFPENGLAESGLKMLRSMEN